MLAVITRSVVRRSTAQHIRCLAQKPGAPSEETDRPRLANLDTGIPEPSEHQPVAPLPSGIPSLDFSPPEPTEQPRRTGAKSSKGSLSSAELRRRNMGRFGMAVLAVAFGAHTIYMGREWDVNELKEKKMTIEEAPSTRWGRTKERYTDLFDYFNKPAWPELLPPQYPPPGKPYTLLISIDDLLVTSTWDRQHGWRTAKRPGVDYFLGYLSQFYEVVIFTSQNYYTALPILEKLDKYGLYISHRLFREATRSIHGKIVKDLSYLNRDLSKVISLDTDPEHVSTHPENAIVIPKWKGESMDTGLVAMIPFLESIAIYKPPDVRPILQAYAGQDIPLEYAKKEAEAKSKHVEEWKTKKGISSNPFSSMFSPPAATHGSRSAIPPTYLEQKRREAQLQYKEEQNYIAQHREELEGMLKREQDAIAGETPGSLWEALDHFRGMPKKKDEELDASKHPTNVPRSSPPVTPSSSTS